MPRFIAFLRAINVGGHTVKMADLRVLFESLGFAQVETFIASGNVIFDTPAEGPGEAALEAQIMAHLQATLGYPVETFLRTPAELAATARHQPFPDLADLGGSLMVGFLHAAPAAEAQQRLAALASPIDSFHTHGREIYWHRRPPIGDSQVGNGAIERALRLPATIRNITTVAKIAAKYPA